MILYHGTSEVFVYDLTSSKIDVTKGGGEFGQGFYTGSKVYLVSAWAWHRFQNDMAVISYDVDDNAMLDLKIKQLDTNQAVCKRKEIRKSKRKRELVFMEFDLVIGPVVGRPYADYMQFVFVGIGGQTFINRQKTEQLWKK